MVLVSFSSSVVRLLVVEPTTNSPSEETATCSNSLVAVPSSWTVMVVLAAKYALLATTKLVMPMLSVLMEMASSEVSSCQ